MKWKARTVEEIAEMICGDREGGFFKYLSSSYITRFFRDSDTDYAHDGSTRRLWIADVLQQILDEPHPNPQTPPETMARIIRTLMDPQDAFNEKAPREGALRTLNASLKREGFEAFYGEDDQCYIRHVGTGTVASGNVNPHRPLSKLETERREQLVSYLDQCSEDELIEVILLPLFRQLGFHRITAAGHKDKALEYGKDIWMKYTLPTLHVLYFGIQVKKGKLDSSGVTKGSHANVAEIYNQVVMMLGHEIFDPELSRRVLVDHAFIVAGGEITKAARNWLGNKLDQTKRSQILFMDRDDIVNMFVVTSLAVPRNKPKGSPNYDDPIPF
ncbi:hypothetical protein [Pseudomonas frederiksbergensis]|uniref:Restriction endonuclease n=1 Tax=Pseudomonas frederiksbergensis TaxID=104087 RepID=A0A423HNQ7_9PSED|nr:hypothetical protein [Pseudomonas frederiksbergensis]RON14797.1 hypothetical protein BK662_14910 [Pseudomonas frederiksbergensis]